MLQYFIAELTFFKYFPSTITDNSHIPSTITLKKKKLYGPFLWMGFNCLKATTTSRRQFTFYHSVPRNCWYSFYQPRKDERLSRPWSHPVVLHTGLLDWESRTLTSRPSLNSVYIVCTYLFYITPSFPMSN